MTPLFPFRRPIPGEIERSLARYGFHLLIGVDEAGRGALCGPVVAGAVVLPTSDPPQGIDDSKILKPARREALEIEIKAWALNHAVASVSPEDIDRMNILQATFKAMRLAIRNVLIEMSGAPDMVVVDGPHTIPDLDCRQKAVVKGDSRSLCIAAASILAKVQRDRIMRGLANRFPGYGLERNKGYGTPEHLVGLKRLGATPIHRRSFCHGQSRPAETI